jgi:hypothetical protein
LNSGRNTSFSEYEQKKILEIVKDTLKEKISIAYKDVPYILDSLNFESLKNISDIAKYFRI